MKSKEQTAIEEYENIGAIRCRECGLDLVETDFAKPYCPRIDCKGIIFSEIEVKSKYETSK